jgi:prepilin-type N-terminal cleavage/methylation domain-containing protein
MPNDPDNHQTNYSMVLSEGETKMKNLFRARGFTLIELLVVIAIIAILAAILFPVFAQAKAKAQQAQCLSNTKNLTLAFMMYIQDWNERFPPHT